MDRDDLASLDRLSEPQAADERIDVPLDCDGGANRPTTSMTSALTSAEE